jgi:alpha-amylase/alpha-mannosidase (GH57 family)
MRFVSCGEFYEDAFMSKCLVIHGHFYQPPRENAWTEAIERQDSAQPYHDWNERINAESYRTNAFARILDPAGRITTIVNNYAHMSFNFGPTLLSWLERHGPAAYRRILEADKLSAARCSGHGNAIAQAYNHAILPLCNERDKITQVRWGLADFRYRFGREPEAMWLPETAVNDATLRVLIDHGMKFVILSPYQAKRVRRFSISEIRQTATVQEANPTGAASHQPPATIDDFHAGEWTGVEHGEIDTRQAYRWFDKDAAGHRRTERYIDIFFYHGGLSRGVGFEHLLRDAKNFSQRIDDCFSPDFHSEEKIKEGRGSAQPELVSIATDGETYGHHERHGEMGLAYLLNIEAPQRHIRVTNYAEFLAENPPVMEVELKEGPNGEGTAWSCAHGLGRWTRHCGCRGDGPPEWNQEWRAPLRQALDNLRDELAALTVEIGEPLLKDVWEARNDYIDVILRRTPESFDEFLAKHQKRLLSESERIDIINLMEMQRQTQLMYTSCGWFFTELSGIETVQVIQYAARALRLAENLSGRSYEERFLTGLKKARSNMTEYKHGENVYKKLVKPSMVTFPRVVNTHAIRALFAGAPAQERLYHYSIQRTDLVEKRTEHTTLMIGRVEVQSGVTTSKHTYAFALINHGAGEGVKCFVRRDDGPAADAGWNYAAAREALIADFSKREQEIIDELPQRWGGEAFDLGAMLAEERQQVINILLEGRLSEISEFYLRIYTQNRHQMQALRGLGANLPAELSVPARYTLSRQLREEIMKLHNVTDPEAYKPCLEIARAAHRLGLQLENQQPSRLFQDMIEQRLQHLFHNGAGQACKEIATLVDIADRLKLTLDETSIQNHIFAILQQHVDGLIDRILAAPQIEQDYDCVSSFLNIAYRFNFNIKKYKDRLKPVEQAWSQDPRYWP